MLYIRNAIGVWKRDSGIYVLYYNESTKEVSGVKTEITASEPQESGFDSGQKHTLIFIRKSSRNSNFITLQ